jgi:hypothetical protein
MGMGIKVHAGLITFPRNWSDSYFGQILRYNLRAPEVVRFSKLSESTRSSQTTRFCSRESF